MKIALGALNQMSREEFIATLAGIFEHSPWIPEACFEARPFPSIEFLHGAMVEIVERAPNDAKLRLLQAHPELAGKAARENRLTAQSATEQASLGMDRLDAEEGARFASLNWLYRQRFGFPFIIAVRGQRDRKAILQALETRANNGDSEEVATALGEVAKIAWFRLSDLIEP